MQQTSLILQSRKLDLLGVAPQIHLIFDMAFACAEGQKEATALQRRTDLDGSIQVKVKAQAVEGDRGALLGNVCWKDFLEGRLQQVCCSVITPRSPPRHGVHGS